MGESFLLLSRIRRMTPVPHEYQKPSGEDYMFRQKFINFCTAIGRSLPKPRRISMILSLGSDST